jgi:hypothetical protein
MGRYRGLRKRVPQGWKERIVSRLGEGKVVPLLSNAICNDLVFSCHRDIVDGWANWLEYPLSDRGYPAPMAQFHSVLSRAQDNREFRYIKDQYLEFLEAALFNDADEELLRHLQADTGLVDLHFTEKALRLGCPHPKALRSLAPLAEFPLPVFLTTSYHTFLEVALKQAGKKPRTEFCRWYRELEGYPDLFDPGSDEIYIPTKEEPLVYHLHGIEEHCESLVLTEDDHLDFMATVLSNKEIVGYDLRDWDFKVVFRGLIKPGSKDRRPKAVAIQVSPQDDAIKRFLENQPALKTSLEAVWDQVEDIVQEQNHTIKDYLEDYLRLEAGFEVIWGNVDDVVQELWEAWVAKQEPLTE